MFQHLNRNQPLAESPFRPHFIPLSPNAPNVKSLIASGQFHDLFEALNLSRPVVLNSSFAVMMSVQTAPRGRQIWREKNHK